MKEKLLTLLDAEPEEWGRVSLLLIMSFFMGVFIATMSVASQALFLKHFFGQDDLPTALLLSGGVGLFVTIVYNFFQNRIPFGALATISLIVLTGLTAFIEFGEKVFSNPNTIYYLGFAAFIPFSYIIVLIFWGAFGRLFNLRQTKRLIGSVDQGAMIASFLAFFLIPQALGLENFHEDRLYTVSLVSIVCFTGLFIYLNTRFLGKERTFAQEKTMYRKVSFGSFFSNPYLRYVSLFVVVSMIAVNFVDYNFLKVTTDYMDGDSLAIFISYFEMSIVIFALLFDLFAVDRIIKEYGMRVSLLINPLLIGFFIAAGVIIGIAFNASTKESSFFIGYFIIVAISKLFIKSIKETMDETSFKLYLIPIESDVRIDINTKIQGTVTAFASLISGGLIYVIATKSTLGLLYITAFTLPFFAAWYFVTNKMHLSYRKSLQDSLTRGKEKSKLKKQKEYSLSTLLEKEVNSTAEDKVIYGLKLMEKLEPALFENAVVRLTESTSPKIKAFATEKMKGLGIEPETAKTTVRNLAESALSASEDSDLLSITPEKLIRLSKSGKQPDRILAAKLLRKITSPRTIFVLLELLRDVDPRVRLEALYTARKVNRPETWPVLIELLASPTFSHQAAAALKQVGEPVLPVLEAAFHKSGQSDLVMLRIVQIMGKIGSRQALELLWRKADYPDKRIVKQILYSLRFINYKAQGREVRDVNALLEAEMSKTIWNLAAINELPDEPHFKFLREALQEEVVDNYDQIIMLLSILYDPESLQLVRENIESGDPDNLQFAIELLDLFIDPELKPKLLPLLDDTSTIDKLNQLQIHFPRESYNPIQVINYILNRDYNYNNRWTKVCAIHAAAYIEDFRVSRGLVAQMFNADKLLQETAAWVIYNKDKSAWEKIAERLPAKDKRFLDASIENNQLLDGLNDGFFLFIEMVMFIKQTPAFRNIHGLLLSDLADKIIPLDMDAKEKIKFAKDDGNTPVFIVAHGSVKIWNDTELVTNLNRGDVFGEIFQQQQASGITAIEATERSVVFKINLMDFYFVLANHHELVQGLIRNITEEKTAAE
jgi:ATP:ADP antiporter, AAA family